MQKSIRTRLAFTFILLAAALTFWRPVQAASDVVVVDVEGVVFSWMHTYLERVIDEAESADAHAVVIQLDTPGGEGGSMSDIVKLIRSAKVPVIVYVGPAGAEAGSAGAVITVAGHISAMAPGTAIGAASPIDATGQDLDETLYKKITEFMSAEMRSLTENRPQEAQDLAEAMILDARAVSATEALEVGLIDVVADNIADLLQQIDGRTVTVDGEDIVLETAGAATIGNGMRLLEQFQQLISSNTELIGILLSLGALALIVEIRAPGGYVAGIVGVLCLGVAFFALGQLPFNYFGVILLVLAFIAFVLETQTPTFGILTMLGTFSLIGGLVMLFDTPDAPSFIRISFLTASGITLPLAAMFAYIAYKISQIQRIQPQTGQEGLIGMQGLVKKQFKPFGSIYRGTVLVNGELWTALSAESLKPDTPIQVDKLEGFTTRVSKIEIS